MGMWKRGFLQEKPYKVPVVASKYIYTTDQRLKLLVSENNRDITCVLVQLIKAK